MAEDPQVVAAAAATAAAPRGVTYVKQGEQATPSVDQAGLNASHLDAMWMIIAGVLVFFMQAGFAMLEAGSVRAKNTKSIMMKNLLDASVAAIGWTVIGYMIAFPGSGQVMMTNDSLGGLKNSDGDQHKDFFFQFTFNATAATIVSGALAERTKIEGYIIFTLIMTTVIYPIVVSWTWGYGFLYDMGYYDFAGSGIVHMCGGVSALAAAICVGPRTGRFDGGDPREFLPGNFGMVCLGTLILWVGWYGFNAGSTLGMSTSPSCADLETGVAVGDNTFDKLDCSGTYPTTYQTAGRCCMTTTLGAACGGVAAFILGSLLNKYYDVVSYCNGILAGLVAVTAGTGDLDSWSAMVAGAIGGVLYIVAAKGLEKCKVDDPIGAFGVHGASGAWGAIAVGLFGNTSVLGANLAGVGVIAGFSFGSCLVLFGVLRLAKILRASPEAEEAGLDAECEPATAAAKAAESDASSDES